jgi:hypothetical protein
MEKHIGSKVIRATPMNRLEYNNLRGWEVPSDENPQDEGYLVEYLDGGRANVEGFEGYVSWSPKDVFDKAYRKSGEMSFGDALEVLKAGGRVARKGWNGKKMFLFLLPAGTVPTKAIHDPALREVIESELGGDTFEALGSIRMWTADKKVLTGWLASQTDMLTNDWVVVSW